MLLVLAPLSHTGVRWLNNPVWRDCCGRFTARLCCLCCADPWGREQIWAEMVKMGEAGALCGFAISACLFFCFLVVVLSWVSIGKLEIHSEFFLVITEYSSSSLLQWNSNYWAGGVARLIELLPHKLEAPVQSPAQRRLGVATHTWTLSAWVVEVEHSGDLDHSWLQRRPA